MKDKITMEYSPITKEHEIMVNDEIIGKVCRVCTNYYEAYFGNKFVGSFKNPYTAKEEILCYYYPDRKEKKEQRKNEREFKRALKEQEYKERKQREKEEHNQIINRMRKMRENEYFRNNYYKAFIKTFPEYNHFNIDEVCSKSSIFMNGIILHIINGTIQDAIKRNNDESRILKYMLNNGMI